MKLVGHEFKYKNKYWKIDYDSNEDSIYLAEITSLRESLYGYIHGYISIKQARALIKDLQEVIDNHNL